jgi:hypothetical protein
MTEDKISVEEICVAKATVDEMTVDEMAIVKMTCGQIKYLKYLFYFKKC